MKRRKKIRRRKSTRRKIKKGTKIFGVSFDNRQWLDAALIHPSYRNETRCGPEFENFDRLEFLGDSILNFVVCRKLYKLFPEADEGGLSRLRSILVSRKILFRVARELGLSKHILLGKSLKRQKEFLKAKIFADALEALLAALYFDQGFEKTEKFILKHFAPFFDAKKLLRLDPNPKSTLQELVQRHWQKLPVYNLEPAGPRFKSTVHVHPATQAAALGRNRQEAEEKAARLLIRILRQELFGRSAKKSSRKK